MPADLPAPRDPATVGRRRLMLVTVLVASLMITLLARLYYQQLLDPNKPVQSAGLTHGAAIVVPAPRGQIVDDTGQVLVGNHAVQQITVDHDLLQQRPDHGRGVLRRLASLLHTPWQRLAKEIRPCSPTVSAPCSTGEPYAPVTVAEDASTGVVLAISEHREQFPGVAVRTVSRPQYPHGSLAAHVLGYTSQITASDKKADPSLHDVDTIGAAGLEQEYDAALRGVDGQHVVQLNPQGYTVGTGRTTPAQQGDTLVTSIDSRLQALAQSSLARQIRDSHHAGYTAPSGAVVIMDPQTGRILASASYPTYDPQQFIGGISEADYRKLTRPSAGVPLLDRATAGQYAPGSTFKLITSSSLLMHHEITTHGIYPCPGSMNIAGGIKTNYDSEDLGPIDLRDALGYSCDTFFYRPEVNEYYRDQARIAKGKKPLEHLQAMARQYGVGTAPGVDLPAGEQATGSYADRETRMARWKAQRATYCAEARPGYYQNVTDASQRAFLTELAKENCTDGWRYRAGDNADMSIGQGETTMSPLQLAVDYSAAVNGGKLYEPTFGRAVVDAKGKVVRTIDPTLRRRVPVKQRYLNFFDRSLDFSRGWAVSGAFAYIGSPYQNRIGGKTGTAQVEGQQDTSWLATWGPTYNDHGAVKARFVMVGMVTEAGTGATAAGPMLKRIWDGIFGAGGHRTPLLPGLRPRTSLPKLTSQDGTGSR